MKLVLWSLIILGLLSALPFAFLRSHTESTSKQVEFVFDYRDILEVSSYRNKPSEYMLARLLELKQAGVTSMAVYESTLRELELSGRIQTLTSSEAAMLTGFKVPANEKSTYVLFLGGTSEQFIRPIVESSFARLGVELTPWSFGELNGVELSMPRDEAYLQAMDPDPITMAELQKLGFRLVARLTDQRQPFDAGHMEKLLANLAGAGVNRIVFEGGAVTGAADDAQLKSLPAMAALMNKYGIGIATIELSKPQAGFNKLAYLTDYNVVRLHSLPANMSGMAADDLVARFTLAAKDRNIRMIFLNAEAQMDASLGIRKDTIANILKSLEGEQGALAALQREGFAIGTAVPFQAGAGLPSGVELGLKAFVTLGAVALIALTISAFFPALALLALVVGAIGSAGLYLLSTTLLSQGLALGVGIAAAVLAVLFAVRRADELGPAKSPMAGALQGVKLLIVSSLISFIGIAYIVALLNHISYLYVLQQYRGVSLLHAAPIFLSFVYVLFFHGQSGIRDAGRRLKGFLNTKVTVLWVVAGAIVALGGLYYMSRTGNAGQASDLERLLRATLQETLGVRPRTKEFLLAHPIFILGVYFAATARKRLGLLLIAAGSIGQLSMIDTFAHLHTPLMISLIRNGYGLLFGILAGIILVGIVALAEKGWAKWANTPQQS